MAVFPVQSQCLSVFLSVSVRVYEILAGKTKINKLLSVNEVKV